MGGSIATVSHVEMASHRDAEQALLLQLKTFGMTALEDFRIARRATYLNIH